MSEAAAVPDNVPVLPPAPPRESLVSTAVKFLQSPKVLDSSLDDKKQFLLKKGLTEEEIALAISRAGVPVDGSVQPRLHSSPPLPSTAQPVSIWTRAREYSAIAMIVGGVIYGLYSLYKHYIEPIFIRSSEEQQKKFEHMEEGVKTIKEDLGLNMQEIRATMHEMQEKINAQTMKLNQVSSNLSDSKSDSHYSSVSNSSIGELKAEITSIKGLLLSRNQFPSQPLLKPVIPSWQLKPNDSASISKKQEDVDSAEDIPDEKKNNHTSMNGTVDLHGEKTNHVNGFASEDNDGVSVGTGEN